MEEPILPAYFVVDVLTHPRSALGIAQLRKLAILGSSAEILDVAWNIMKAASSSIECFIWQPDPILSGEHHTCVFL
jgi:hypothetical protein